VGTAVTLHIGNRQMNILYNKKKLFVGQRAKNFAKLALKTALNVVLKVSAQRLRMKKHGG
jgi:hypothetical protein